MQLLFFDGYYAEFIWMTVQIVFGRDHLLTY